jgi:hypothetical protein
VSEGSSENSSLRFSREHYLKLRKWQFIGSQNLKRFRRKPYAVWLRHGASTESRPAIAITRWKSRLRLSEPFLRVNNSGPPAAVRLPSEKAAGLKSRDLLLMPSRLHCGRAGALQENDAFSPATRPLAPQVAFDTCES